jgi:hypothetical protein
MCLLIPWHEDLKKVWLLFIVDKIIGVIKIRMSVLLKILI